MDKIVRLARAAALDVPGVSRLAGPLDVILLPKQIKMDMYDMDVYLIVKAGSKIPEVAWDVQVGIMKSLKAEGIESVEHINIHVQGVDF